MKQLSLSIVFLIGILLFSFNVESKNFVLVIDAGHGGKDIGAPGVKTNEKNINLEVALKFGALVEKNMDDVDVVYTRKRDKYVTLQERANIANDAKGDLFVSIHTNSLDKRAKGRKTVQGSSTYTLGLHRTKENLAVAMRENSVIALEEDYSTTYQGFDPNSSESYIIFEINQNQHMAQSVNFASLVQDEFKITAKRVDRGVRQAGFLVLYKTSMPAVLVELDFICNPTQEQFMRSDNGQDKLAQALYNAFERYRKLGDSASVPSYAPPVEDEEITDESGEPQEVENNSGITYKIQFLAGRVKLPSNSSEFKGLKGVERYKDGKMYKYLYGATSSYEEAVATLKKVRRKFKDAYIVEFEGDKLKK